MAESDAEQERIDVEAPHGRLEGLLLVPPVPVAAAVVCHPHPLHGGTMANNVVYRLAHTLAGQGIAALRFNFRGVGRSTGVHDHGRGEQDDVRAALDHLAARFPDLPLWATGFSFGARVGLSVGAREARVERLLGVGLALGLFDFAFLETTPKPKAIVQAAGDEFGDAAAITAAFARFAEPKRLDLVADAPHLFTGHLDAFAAAATRAVAFLRR